MSKTHFPVSNATDEGKRLRAALTQLIRDWNDLIGERGIILQKKDLVGNSGQKVVSGAVTSTGLIKLTVTAHGYSTGNQIVINSVGGTIEANGTWPITVVDANSFTLNSSVFANAFASNGTAQLASVFATVGSDYFLGADANEKTANACRGFAEIESAFGIADGAIRQMIARLM